ncbi:hypothetical protein [Novosphingobium album (ex Liu et al. 2023)]|uniref:Uncharacterized protein n=1 Tax=Novosphingobium album (ex Liu et al. 2023) TaxID=3031130 RepID=A0ABT5WJN4_9SPHN|nr:hypothetical protein [Novosphingobium album (ex Liu et al. 2023)]MDE8650129.1 hypothetical protein [Novosphingobium album (ex Liu et al. 2023)]
MYEFVDRPLSTLDPGCRFLVWSMRAWVMMLGNRACPAQAIAPAFARWRMIGGLQPFHRAMLIFNRDALETFAFCSLGCDHVSEHEALILSLACQLRETGPEAARDTLLLLVAEDSVGDLLEALASLNAAMAVAGIFPGEAIQARDSRA